MYTILSVNLTDYFGKVANRKSAQRFAIRLPSYRGERLALQYDTITAYDVVLELT